MEIYVGNSLFVTNLMRIFSSFDTKYKHIVLEKYAQEHGEENILVLQRSQLFAWIYVYIPTIVYTTMLIAVLYSILVWITSPSTTWISIAITILVYLFVIFPIIKRYIDLKLDFTVVTPAGVYLYNQRGIFYRTMSALNIDNIRTINVQKSNMIYTIFDNGDIIFLSEWPDADAGQSDYSLWHAKIYYVYDPESKKDKIQQIFKKGREHTSEES